MKAIWKDTVIAESDDTLQIEGNHYFPKDSIKREYFKPSPNKTTCHWKGEASYYTVVVNGDENRDAAWYYPTPKESVKQIKERVAFWKGVMVTK